MAEINMAELNLDTLATKEGQTDLMFDGPLVEMG